MRIPGLKVARKKAVVILGAGASRGASCFRDSINPAPLDADFFSLMERIQHRDVGLPKLLEFVKTEFGEHSFPRMEEMFTQIEALSEFHKHLNISRGPRISRYEKQLEAFVGNIASFFKLIFVNEADGQHRSCEHHDRLAELLHSEDVVLTFNYDCLMDTSLKRKAGIRWDPERSYGVQLTPEAASAWRPERLRGRPAQSPILLLKLHGSMNWNRSDGEDPEHLKLRENPYTSEERSKSEVIPPVWDKSINQDLVLKQIWKEARRTLPMGPILVVIGYSVPATDLLSRALIRVAVSERASNQKLSHLVVVNPDSEARRRLVRLVQGGMDSWTTIVELSNLEELQKLLN